MRFTVVATLALATSSLAAAIPSPNTDLTRREANCAGPRCGPNSIKPKRAPTIDLTPREANCAGPRCGPNSIKAKREAGVPGLNQPHRGILKEREPEAGVPGLNQPHRGILKEREAEAEALRDVIVEAVE